MIRPEFEIEGDEQGVERSHGFPDRCAYGRYDAVNDVFVMTEWKKVSGAEGKIEFLADGNGDFAKALDLTMDGSAGGLGLRSKRYSMLVENGVVKQLNIEDAPGKAETSSAETLLKQL